MNTLTILMLCCLGGYIVLAASAMWLGTRVDWEGRIRLETELESYAVQLLRTSTYRPIHGELFRDHEFAQPLVVNAVWYSYPDSWNVLRGGSGWRRYPVFLLILFFLPIARLRLIFGSDAFSVLVVLSGLFLRLADDGGLSATQRI